MPLRAVVRGALLKAVMYAIRKLLLAFRVPENIVSPRTLDSMDRARDPMTTLRILKDRPTTMSSKRRAPKYAFRLIFTLSIIRHAYFSGISPTKARTAQMKRTRQSAVMATALPPLALAASILRKRANDASAMRKLLTAITLESAVQFLIPLFPLLTPIVIQLHVLIGELPWSPECGELTIAQGQAPGSSIVSNCEGCEGAWHARQCQNQSRTFVFTK